MLNFLDLPEEVILSVFKCLSVHEVANARKVCHRLNDVLQAEQLWKYYCMKDYSIPSAKVWYAWTHQEFYSKGIIGKSEVLKKTSIFLFMSGKPWVFGKAQKVEPDGIFGYDCLPPLDESFRPFLPGHLINIISPLTYNRENLHKLRYRRIFCLKPVGKQVLCFCYQSLLGYLDRIGHSPCPDASSENHSCSELCHNDKMFVCKTEDGFKFVCHQPDKHDYNIDYLLEIEHGFRPVNSHAVENILNNLYYNLHYHLRIKKFDTLLKLCCYYDVVPLNLSSDFHCQPGLVKSGLYFGTYSSHGWEILNVYYCQFENKPCLCGVKITGDPNIPAGQVSFRVYLDKPLHFLQTDQATLHDVRLAIERNEKDLYKEILRNSGRQRFATPLDCVERESESFPEFCLSRYVAEGQIAHMNYTEPSFTSAVFSAFEENAFGFLWLELSALSIYYRVNNMQDDFVDH